MMFSFKRILYIGLLLALGGASTTACVEEEDGPEITLPDSPVIASSRAGGAGGIKGSGSSPAPKSPDTSGEENTSDTGNKQPPPPTEPRSKPSN